eukprot:118715-Hanusia_phi.AAC.3
MVLPSSNVDTQGLRNFSCKNLDLKYRCQCEGSDCPQTYCASSQCYAVSNGDECSAPCSPQVTDPDCPKGTFAVFKKSYPFCPQNSQRFSCEHFDRCEPYGGEGLHTSDLKVDKGEGTNINKRFLTRNSASKHGIFGAFGVIVSFIGGYRKQIFRCYPESFNDFGHHQLLPADTTLHSQTVTRFWKVYPYVLRNYTLSRLEMIVERVQIIHRFPPACPGRDAQTRITNGLYPWSDHEMFASEGCCSSKLILLPARSCAFGPAHISYGRRQQQHLNNSAGDQMPYRREPAVILQIMGYTKDKRRTIRCIIWSNLGHDIGVGPGSNIHGFFSIHIVRPEPTIVSSETHQTAAALTFDPLYMTLFFLIFSPPHPPISPSDPSSPLSTALPFCHQQLCHSFAMAFHQPNFSPGKHVPSVALRHAGNERRRRSGEERRGEERRGLERGGEERRGEEGRGEERRRREEVKQEMRKGAGVQ